MQQSFADLGVSAPVVEVLAKQGITTPFAIQCLVIRDVMAGHDVLAKSPTGSGKTLAFALPIVERIQRGRGPSALILVPTRELAGQVAEEFRPLMAARGLRVTAVYGGVSIQNQARLVKTADVLVATPGRLEDLLLRRMVSLDSIRTLVLDEADRMLDMGFQPQVDKIVARTPRNRQTLFFSATLEGAAGKLADAYTTDARRHEHTPAVTATKDIEHRFVSVAHDSKVDALVAALTEDRDLALVFVRTKRGADRLVKKLEQAGIDAVAMHGDKSQAAREKALHRFGTGRVSTLIATDVAARGIDVDRISHVINFDAPEDRDGYVHRIGRTGRAGRTGVGITFVVDDQARDMSRIAADLSLHSEWDAAGFSSTPTRGQAPRGRSVGGGRRPGASSGARSSAKSPAVVWGQSRASRSGRRG